MRNIAEKEGISRKYLHALLTALRGAGLVRSVRGSGGGYVLARAPGDIRLRDLLEALEGSLALSECSRNEGVCERADYCVGRDVWRELGGVLEDFLGNITLEEMLSRVAEKEANPSMYYI